MAAITCRGQCGATAATDDEAMHRGWSFLQITGGWRCGRCEGELLAAGRLVGTDDQTADELPPDSRGALPRETASGIVAPAVKG